jgi:hypothetical protein
MRWGIATLHYGLNEGAILQAWCLAKHLGRCAPQTTFELIDHRYPAKLGVYRDFPIDSVRRRSLEAFIEDRLPLSPIRSIDDSCEETLAGLAERYDGIVVGSDEVWRFRFDAQGRQLDAWATPVPNLYWPGDEVRVPRVAYAASAGVSDVRGMPGEVREKLAASLRGFRQIGVRDRWTVEVIRMLAPDQADRVEWVPDPVFAHRFVDDVDVDALKVRLERAGMDFARRVALLVDPHPDLEPVVRSLDLKGFQVCSLFPSKDVDVDLSGEPLDPLEWAVTLGLVDFGVTGRTHGLVSFLLGNTPCYTLDRRLKTFELSADVGLPVEVYTRGRARAIIDAWPSDRVAARLDAYARRAREYATGLCAPSPEVEPGSNRGDTTHAG